MCVFCAGRRVNTREMQKLSFSCWTGLKVIDWAKHRAGCLLSVTQIYHSS